MQEKCSKWPPRPKRLQESKYFKPRCTNASPEVVSTDEENRLFLELGEQVTNVDDDVDDTTQMIKHQCGPMSVKRMKVMHST
ncbi:hypothetical protein Tco_0060312 [Tanacetum coccineum]